MGAGAVPAEGDGGGGGGGGGGATGVGGGAGGGGGGGGGGRGCWASTDRGQAIPPSTRTAPRTAARALLVTNPVPCRRHRILVWSPTNLFRVDRAGVTLDFIDRP